MFSELRSRFGGLRRAVRSAKKNATDLLALHGDNVWERLSDLEARAWKNGAYTEYAYWKLVREYVKDASKVERP